MSHLYQRIIVTAFGLILMFMSGFMVIQAQEATIEPQDQDTDASGEIDYYIILNDIDEQPTVLVTFIEEPDYGTVAVLVQAQNLTPGWHSMSVTSGGACDAADNFQSAGEIYNPTNETYPNRGGDLIPLYAMQDGNAAMSFRTDQLDLTGGQDVGSLGIVLSEGFGDAATDTAGGRIACGAMTQGAAPADVFFLDSTDMNMEMTEEAGAMLEATVDVGADATEEAGALTVDVTATPSS